MTAFFGLDQRCDQARTLYLQVATFRVQVCDFHLQPEDRANGQITTLEGVAAPLKIINVDTE